MTAMVAKAVTPIKRRLIFFARELLAAITQKVPHLFAPDLAPGVEPVVSVIAESSQVHSEARRGALRTAVNRQYGSAGGTVFGRR